MNQKLRNALVRIILLFILTLGLLTTLEVVGTITARVFAILCVAAMIIFTILIARMFRMASSLLATTAMRRGPSKRKRLLVLSCGGAWLMLAFWLTRGEPWLPRLVGAAVVIAFLAPFAVTRRGRSDLSE